jgi:hypothetical protein
LIGGLSGADGKQTITLPQEPSPMTLIKTSRCAFLAATTLFVVASASAVDDSVWINQEIKSAILTGQTEYRLPAGTYTIENPIVIPDGTSNFTLRGAGMDETTIKTPNKKLNYAIGVGVITMCHNNWGLTNRQNSLVANTKTGSRTLQLLANQTPPQPGYYVLWDQNVVLRISGDNGSMNHAEVVKVQGYDAVSRTVTLDCPVGREYNVNPRLADLRSGICTNVAVTDLGFDGTAPSSTFTTSFVSAGISDGLVLGRLKVTNYVTNAISTNLARNVLIEGTVVDGATAGGPGGGYGVAIYRSRFVTIKNCTDYNARHSFIMHSGSMDVLVDGCSTGPGGFDLHGYDERRIVFQNCTGNGINVGNDAYLAGARDVWVKNCNFTAGEIGLHQNVRNIYFLNTTAPLVSLYYTAAGSTKATPSGGFADSILFQGCTIQGTAGNGLLMTPDKFGALTFIGCTFDYKRTDWGMPIKLVKGEGTINMVNCTVINRAPGYSALTMQNANSRFLMTIRGCNFSSPAGCLSAIYVSSAFAGKVTMSSNTYSTKTANATFIRYQTPSLSSHFNAGSSSVFLTQ